MNGVGEWSEWVDGVGGWMDGWMDEMGEWMSE